MTIVATVSRGRQLLRAQPRAVELGRQQHGDGWGDEPELRMVGEVDTLCSSSTQRAALPATAAAAP